MTIVLCGPLVKAEGQTKQQKAAQLFDEAEAVRKDRRLGEARNLLRESLRLHKAPATAFNLANVHADMSEYLEAIRIFSDLSRGTFGKIPESRMPRILERLKQCRAALAFVLIENTTDMPVTVEVDGKTVKQEVAEKNFRVPADPGERAVTLQVSTGQSQSQTFWLRSGLEGRFLFAPAPLPSRPLRKSALFWTILTLSVAAIVTTTVLLIRANTSDVFVDPILGNIITSRPPR